VSAPQWKPGDVGVAATGERFIVDSEGRCFWPGSEDARTVGVSGRPAPQDRPLVVIDPEDRPRVDQFTDILAAAGVEVGPVEVARYTTPTDSRIHYRQAFEDKVQQALRSLIAPPRPEEPMGLGAVVEDADGVLWVQTGHDVTNPWSHGSNGGHLQPRAYDKIDGPKVLFEGWRADD
jgi:hypothetical protein